MIIFVVVVITIIVLTERLKPVPQEAKTGFTGSLPGSPNW